MLSCLSVSPQTIPTERGRRERGREREKEEEGREREEEGTQGEREEREEGKKKRGKEKRKRGEEERTRTTQRSDITHLQKCVSVCSGKVLMSDTIHLGAVLIFQQ